MVIYCFIPNCKSFGTNGFHSFPTEPKLREKWKVATKTTHLGAKENQKVCRKHFKASELLTDIDGKKRLIENAVPSMFLPRSAMLDWDHNYSVVNDENF